MHTTDTAVATIHDRIYLTPFSRPTCTYLHLPAPTCTYLPQAELTELKEKEKQLYAEMPGLVENLYGYGCEGSDKVKDEDGAEAPADPEAGGGRQEGEAEEEEEKGGEETEEEVEKAAVGGDAAGGGSRRRTKKSLKQRVDAITRSAGKKPLKDRVHSMAQKAGKMRNRIR